MPLNMRSCSRSSESEEEGADVGVGGRRGEVVFEVRVQVVVLGVLSE